MSVFTRVFSRMREGIYSAYPNHKDDQFDQKMVEAEDSVVRELSRIWLSSSEGAQPLEQFYFSYEHSQGNQDLHPKIFVWLYSRSPSFRNALQETKKLLESRGRRGQDYFLKMLMDVATEYMPVKHADVSMKRMEVMSDVLRRLQDLLGSKHEVSPDTEEYRKLLLAILALILGADLEFQDRLRGSRETPKQLEPRLYDSQADGHASFFRRYTKLQTARSPYDLLYQELSQVLDQILEKAENELTYKEREVLDYFRRLQVAWQRNHPQVNSG